MLKCCKNDKIRVIIYIYPLFWASSTKTIPDLLLIKLSFFSWTSWMRDQCWTVWSFNEIKQCKNQDTSYEFDESMRRVRFPWFAEASAPINHRHLHLFTNVLVCRPSSSDEMVWGASFLTFILLGYLLSLYEL